ncbi:uncharacterized protein LOC142163520 [Nicotiana tabacum]|uniref:Uncharacterized protein LOC142163520 n=1 Tax=Nicotiana tabacum TaxID=4097 RepID=A0AC58RW13_TOBAC
MGRTICYRAKCMVLKQFMGDWKLEFSRLCDYVDIIKSTNPGSSCWIRIDKDTKLGKNLFVYFYVSFDALKRGWLEGCRKIIGFDGCFLKGLCKGELLVAVGKNGNNQMFPIAWAVVDQETKHSWTWFIKNLISDLNLGDGVGLTVMSDMQKGLVPTISELLPNVEHRMCARHIWTTWAKNWREEERRMQFWKCAKSSYEIKFKEEITNMAKLGKKEIYEDLLAYNKECWCKAYFSTCSKCDVVENNMCETFNSWIVGPRHKSIITMLEEIRHKIMNRHVDIRRFVETWITDISPMARLILEENKELSRKCKVLWNGDSGFEIGDGDKRFIVDLIRRPCTCRTWQLRGILCAHVVCAFYDLDQEPENEVEDWYRQNGFVKAYQYVIQPMPNMKMWPETNNPSIEPPEPKPMPGRPKRYRRKSKDEPKEKYGKLSKNGPGSTSNQPSQPTQQSQPIPPAPSRSFQTSNPPSICNDTSVVKRVAKISLLPSIPSERVITPGTYKDTSATNIDLGFKPRGHKWKGKNAVTTSQLQQMRATRNIGSSQQNGSNM